MADRVLLIHPANGLTWDCPAEAVDAWLEKGFKRANQPAEKPADSTDPTAPKGK